MPKIYLINIGANTQHQNKARSPIFRDGTFEYISFPDEECKQSFPLVMRRFLSPRCPSLTHLDPDWRNKTYGDNCGNPRARALLKAELNDVLLFWALLWRNTGHGWSGWTGERGWYLIGSIRIEEILKAGEPLSKLKLENRNRAACNAHMHDGKVMRGRNRIDRVFVGLKNQSRQFQLPVDLQIGISNGLLQRTVLTSDGRKVNWNVPPKWNSVTRSCRAVWDLDDTVERERACLVRDAIYRTNRDFDLLAGF